MTKAQTDTAETPHRRCNVEVALKDSTRIQEKGVGWKE